MQKQLFYINSRDRLSGTHSAFTYHFDIDPSIHYEYVSLVSASVPKSFYSVQAGSNTLSLFELAVEYIITIPIGNYSRNSFATTMSSKLTAGSGNAWVYTVTFPNINRTVDDGKYIVTCTGASEAPSLVVTHLDQHLGFDQGTTQNFTSVGGAYILKSANVCNLNPSSTLIVQSNMVAEKIGHIKALFTSSVNSYDYIIYNNMNIMETCKRMVSSKSDVYTIWITDQNNNIIDLNGEGIILVLMIFKII